MDRWNKGREPWIDPCGPEREKRLRAALVVEITLRIIEKQNLNIILECDIVNITLISIYNYV